MNSSPRPSTLYSVQAFRGIAALLVVLMHIGGAQKGDLAPERTAELSLLSGFWDQGYAGVDLFFVISGFIMVYVTQKTARHIKASARFLYARASRIYPLWWVYLGLIMVYFFATYGQISPPNTGTQPSEIIAQTYKSFLLLPQKTLPTLIIGWTLVHEMMFYLIFAGVLLLPRAWLPWVMLVWAVLIGVVFSQYGAPGHASTALLVMFSPLSLEFIMGALAAWIILKLRSPGAKTAITLGALALCAGLTIGLDVTKDGLPWKRALVFGLPFTVLLYGVVSLERAGQLRTPSWLARLGDWSYSLYLSHLLVIMTLKRVWQAADPVLPGSLRFQSEGMWDNLAFSLTAIAATIMFSAISYHLIEQPLLRAARKLWPRKKVAETPA